MKLLKKPMRLVKNWCNLRYLALCCLIFLSIIGCALETCAAEQMNGQAKKILISTGNQTRKATLSENASATAFYDLLVKGPLTIAMHEYGGFEKVGSLGTSITRCDKDITTRPGDIILYQGNKITIYYSENRWELTLIGHIDGATDENMKQFLNENNPKVTFSLLK